MWMTGSLPVWYVTQGAWCVRPGVFFGFAT